MNRILILLLLVTSLCQSQDWRRPGSRWDRRSAAPLLPFTDSMSTGTINARWSGGTWTAVGDSTIISPSLLNGGFETAGAVGADVFGTWLEEPTNGTLFMSTSQIYSGSASLGVTKPTKGAVTYKPYVAISSILTVGAKYRVSMWMKSKAGLIRFGCEGAVANYGHWTPTTSWRRYDTTFVADYQSIYFSCADDSSSIDTVWIDNVTLTRDGYMYSTPTLGPELATDSTVVGSWYSITATQTNYFYTGCAIGYTFRAAARKALDANNKVKRVTFGSTLATVQGGVADVSVSVDAIRTAGTVYGIVMNYADTANCVIAYGDGLGNMKLDKCVNGTWTTVITGAATYAAGGTLKATKTGNNYSLWYRGTQVGSTTAITDASIVSNAVHGLFNTYNAGGNKFDNFSIVRFP